MNRLPHKLVGHKQFCTRCHSADLLSDLCRVGRRLYISWFTALSEEQQVMALFDMPKEMQDDIKERVGIEHITIGGVVLPPQN